MTIEYFDLISGCVREVSKAEFQHDEYMTAVLMQSLGGCDNHCSYTEPYGWVPECGCPVHDKDY